MSNSNINETFVLASYTSSVRGKSTQKHSPGVYATVHKKANSQDEFVTVAVQADGVHISSLHPVISHTLGPSTSFSCPPLTLPSSSSHSSRTYAVILSSVELTSTEEAGRTLWAWQDDTSSAAQKPKQSKLILPINQTAYGLYFCDELPERIIAVTTTGDVSVVDAGSLEVKTTSSQKKSHVIHASMFPASTSFLAQPKGAIIVTASSGSSKTTHLRILAIDEADSISQIQECEIPVDSEQIASVSCSPIGILSILTVDGAWNSYKLLLSSPPVQLSPPLQLSGFSFLSESSKRSVSLLALTSSHVLLAAIASNEITLLIWDLQFSVLLSSHTLPVPSALSSSTLHVRLVPGAQSPTKSETEVFGQAVLILSSIPPKETPEDKTVSVLIVVPYSVPTVSTIAAAMGRGDAGNRWLRASEEEPKQSTDDKARAKLLGTMKTAIQGGRPLAAAEAFMQWVAKQDGQPATPSLDYNFVKELLGITLLLPPSESRPNAVGAATYTPDVVRYLLEQRVVCSAMVPGGLLCALKAKDDWSSIKFAFESVIDLTESEIVECLRTVIISHRVAVADDAMQVDPPTPNAASTSTVVPLPTFLNLLTNYPTSHGPLLLALRKNMRDADDLTAMLRVLDGWITRKTKMDEHLLPSKKDLRKTEQGVWVVVGRKGDKGKKEEIPSLENIVNLLQVILDAAFLSLLQHPPAHKILRRVQEQLNPEIAFAAAAETLRGPLEPFAIAQEKTVKESLISPQEREREKQKGDWRQRKRGLTMGADIGLYKLEELVL
ncbi:hypothetical protein GALMADRAFT_133615 [Galerina marginata CBS 339.88]|uniref:Uncharacterized protein n=1 Tax=Galerina marginata (strain CBS 339.88) TaxID=685588 RepID=A0A067TYX4_GALM3|nr:hypothetical protein GALMADRAFT_133615 [Galerina marginata CBS 339.88]